LVDTTCQLLTKLGVTADAILIGQQEAAWQAKAHIAETGQNAVLVVQDRVVLELLE
tara:strand:- start:40 stop:207 length:168 start_codon:yes stop_codon:yes gene_type:complete